MQKSPYSKKASLDDDLGITTAVMVTWMTGSNDLESLASTHSCVRDLVERNKFLHAQLRILMREPLSRFLQPKARGYLSRKIWHFGRAKASAVKIQAFARMAAARRHFQEHKTAAIAIQSITRGYVVCVSHVVGKVVSKLRLHNKALQVAMATIEDRDYMIYKLKCLATGDGTLDPESDDEGEYMYNEEEDDDEDVDEDEFDDDYEEEAADILQGED